MFPSKKRLHLFSYAKYNKNKKINIKLNGVHISTSILKINLLMVPATNHCFFQLILHFLCKNTARCCACLKVHLN